MITLALLRKFWPYIISGIAIIGLALLINHWRLESGKVPELNKQIATLNAALKLQSERYIAAKNLTQTVEQNYENNLTKLNADIKRLSNRPATCVPVHITPASSGAYAADKPDKQNVGTGVSSAFLIEFAGEAESDRIKVVSLQEFVTKLYQMNTL